MRKIVWFIVFVLIAQIAVAQQSGQYTNFMFNAFAINPANAGLKECFEARIGYRHQWVGFENNPQSLVASGHWRLKKISSERGVIHGLGAIVEADNTGPSSRTTIHGVYAVHLRMNRNTRLSFGVGLGMLQYRFDAALIRVPDPTDPVVAQSKSEVVFPDVKAGVWLYGKGWFAGLSADHLTSPTLSEIGEDVTIQSHYSLMAGKVFPAGEKMSVIPAGLLKFTANTKPSFDANVWLDYDERVAIGLGFRSEDAVSGMLKFNFLDYFTVAYAYDYTYSKIRLGSSNSHEIILGIAACPRNKKAGFVPCHAYD